MKNWRILLGVSMLILCSSCVGAEQPSTGNLGWLSTPSASAAPAVTPTSTPLPTPALTGSEMRLLPARYDVWSCEWAPDGKTIVFAGKLQGELSTKMRIWLWPIAPAADPTPFTNTDTLTDFSPRWSPDGKQLVMLRIAYGRTSSVSGLWLKETPSGSGKQLTSNSQDRDPFWSPDGTEIVFVRGDGPYQSRLMLANLADGTIKVLRSMPQELIYSPCWGVNGKIYFAKLNPYQKNVTLGDQTYQVFDFGKGSIWSFDPRTKALEPVVADEYDNRLPALSPDGSKLAYVSERSVGKAGNGKFDRGSLYIKDLSTGETHFITNKVGLNGGSLSWSPDGKKLAFFTFRSIRPAIWVINFEPKPVSAAGTADPGVTATPRPTQ